MEDVLVYNALDKEVSVQAFGNWFTFKAGQIKRMRKEIGDFIVRERRYMGLVSLPAEFEDTDYKNSEEGVAALEAAKNQGVTNRINHLKMQMHNLNVSLKRDLEMKNIKADPLSFATDGDVAAMEELTAYQSKAQDAEKKRIDRIRNLEKQLKQSSTLQSTYSKPRPDSEKEDE